jgi:hypothetical protein
LTTDDSTMLLSTQTRCWYALTAILTLRRPTIGWPQCCQWEDCSASWGNLTDLWPSLIYNFGTDFHFGTDLPQTVDETLDLDLTNGNILWAARIAMEIKTSRVALQPMSPYLFGTRKSLVI